MAQVVARRVWDAEAGGSSPLTPTIRWRNILADSKIHHRVDKYLPEFVYGGIDGTVTTFAVVAATVGAGLSSNIIIILGLANLIGDGISMAVSAYLSSKSEQAQDAKEGVKAKKDANKIGWATFIAFVLVGFAPLVIYVADALFGFDMSHKTLFIISSILSAFVFISIGWLKSYVVDEPRFRAIAETLILGALASGAAYFLGDVISGLVLK